MTKKKEKTEEELIIPKQDTRICGTICVCQFLLVLSCVSIIYLTVAAYAPSIKDFIRDIDETPIMCTTVQKLKQENCTWVSCYEWCLSTPSGSCIQIYVNLRRNGSTLAFSNCMNSTNKTCFGLDQERAPKLRCIRDHSCDKAPGEKKPYPELMYDNLRCTVTNRCENIHGNYNCSGGNCTDITDAFSCSFPHLESPVKCRGIRGTTNCASLSGIQSCKKGICRKVKEPYTCDRRCVDIPTRNKNVIFINGDNVFLSQCSSAYDVERNEDVWNSKEDELLMLSCYSVKQVADGELEAVDCLNASILQRSLLADQVNYTFLSYLYHNAAELDRSITLSEEDLTISNYSTLMVNKDTCLNTFSGECENFHRTYGADGSNYDSRARYPCFYDQSNTTLVYANFDLKYTRNVFLITFFPPVILLILSCISIALIHKRVAVGDDAKMRLQRAKEVRIILDKSGDSKNEEGDAI